MLIDVIGRFLDPLMFQDWIRTVIAVLSLIPAPMGILLSIAIITAVIRAVL